MKYPTSPPATPTFPSTLTPLSPPGTPRRRFQGKGIPATPARTETVTTTTRTTTTRHGVETETITETITTYEDAHEDSQAANGPPARCPMPNLTRGLPTTSLNPRIKVYAVPTPESLTPVDRQKLYLVTRGEGVGIFTSWQDVLARINGLDGKGIYEIRHGWDDALEVYTIAFKEGTISVEPKPNGPFADTPYVWEPAPNPNAPCLGTHRYHIPAPGDLPYPRPFNTDRFYVVLKGEEVGIFGNWHQTAVRVQNLRHQSGKASWVKCYSWADALRIYSAAFNENRLQVSPIPGGKFDLPLENSAYNTGP